MSTKIQPLHDRVLIKPMEPGKSVKGGIIIPDTAKEKPQEGKVIAVGTSDDFVVKKGNKVIYSKYAGAEIKIDGDDHLLMREEDILGIIK